MKNSLTFIAILMILVGNAQSFHFNSDGIKRQSAGVFDENERLIRTLFSGKVFPANNYTYDWDGLDDKGKIVPKGKYKIKLLTNNIQYKWEGIIGNTSDSVSGVTKWRGYGLANGMATVGEYVYVAQGYGEFMHYGFRFHTSAPNTRLPAISNNGTTQKTGLAVCSDSTYVYWAEWSMSPKGKDFHAWVIHATKVSDNSQVTFPNGVDYAFYYGKPKSVIGLQDQATDGDKAAAPAALAVQKKGQFLFVSRKKSNRVEVYHKRTGALVQILSFQKPTGLSVDKNDNIWIVTEDKFVRKYVVYSDGRLSLPEITIEGLSQPQNVAVSNDGSYILVADCGTSQQLKAYSATTGKSLWVLGQAGGYANSTEVTSTRFMFSDINGIDFSKFQIPSITFQANGSFWFSDNGNRRILHFDANRKYLNQIFFLGPTYYTDFVAGDSARLINNHFEFSIDYSKPVKESWVLKRNYAYRVDASKYDYHHHGLAYPVKYSNGRTYALYRRKGYGNINNTWEIVELREDGLRMTGVIVDKLGITLLAQDGSIIQQSGREYGQSTIIRRKVLLGFDALGNPKYSDFSNYLETPILSTASPVHWGLLRPAITENGYYWFFDPIPKQEPGGFHFGAVPIGGKTWHVQASSGTGKNYKGDFPNDGRFDDGNGVNNYAGSIATAVGKHVVWGYHGEFWRNTQVNKYNHYFENGLFIGQFGVTGDEPSVRGIEAAPQMAGNALLPVLVKGPNGNLYLYHGDETHHGGIHRWKISGIESLEEKVFSLDEENEVSFDAKFSADQRKGCFPLAVRFTDKSDTVAGAITKWFWSFGDGSSSTEANPFHEYKKAGNYTVTLVVTNASGCTQSFSQTNYIEVSEKINIEISNTATACIGTPVTFKPAFDITNAGRFAWKWDFGNGKSDTSLAPGPQIYNTAGTYTVKLTSTNEFGCSSQAQSNVTILSAPKVNAGDDTEVPLGGSVQLRASGAEKYTWDNAGGMSCTNCADPVVNPKVTTQYKVTGVNANGCSTSDVVTVRVVNKQTALQLEAKKDICVGETVTIRASGADQYQWSSKGHLPQTSGEVISVKPVVSTLYTVMAKDNNGNITDTASIYITVRALPVVNAGADAEVVQGGSVQLRASGAEKYSWDNIVGLSCTSCPDPVASPAETTQYKVTGTDAYGCNASDVVSVKVLARVSALKIEAKKDICAGETVEIRASGADQYQWSSTGSLQQTSGAVIIVKPTVSALYKVVAKSNGGSITDTASVYITVHAAPQVNAGADMAICKGEVQRLQATGAAKYTWSASPALSCTSCEGPMAAPATTTSFTVTGYSDFGCSAKDSVLLTVRQPINVTVDPVDDICIGKTVTLSARGADAYSWSPSVGVNNPAAAVTSVSPNVTTQYTVVGKDAAGCFADTAKVQVTVWAAPTVEAGEAQTLTAGQTIKLKPTYSNDVTSYRWSNSQTLNCADCPFPDAAPKNETTYRVEVANNGGCKAQDDVTIRVICSNGNLFIPNTFSPNKDGRNDNFYPRGNGIGRIKSLKIYNRSGDLVFSNENFQANNPAAGWDGRYKGQQLPSDVFLYTCEVVCSNNEVLTYKGDVTLLR